MEKHKQPEASLSLEQLEQVVGGRGLVARVQRKPRRGSGGGRHGRW